MVLPALAALAVVVGYPVVYTLVLSTQHRNLLEMEPGYFVGTQNYRGLLSDPTFWTAIGNTALYTVGTVGIAAILGLALALLTEGLRSRPFRLLRTFLLTPWAVPFVVTAFLFRLIYLQDGGALNALLLSTGVAKAPIPWLNSATLALPSVMVASIWAMVPFFFLVLGAALAAIPDEVVESARVDRAAGWSMVFHIKLPLLRSALLISSLLMVISTFNDFGNIWAMTEGGPGYSTTTLVVYVYRLAFQDYDLGYASAVGLVWLLLLSGCAAVYLRALRARS
jgi:ABC-type sugar transport system permease subunit